MNDFHKRQIVASLTTLAKMMDDLSDQVEDGEVHPIGPKAITLAAELLRGIINDLRREWGIPDGE